MSGGSNMTLLSSTPLFGCFENASEKSLHSIWWIEPSSQSLSHSGRLHLPNICRWSFSGNHVISFEWEIVLWAHVVGIRRDDHLWALQAEWRRLGWWALHKWMVDQDSFTRLNVPAGSQISTSGGVIVHHVWEANEAFVRRQIHLFYPKKERISF